MNSYYIVPNTTAGAFAFRLGRSRKCAESILSLLRLFKARIENVETIK